MDKYEIHIVVSKGKGKKRKVEKIINCTDGLMRSETGYILIDLKREIAILDYWPPDKKWPPEGLKESLEGMLRDTKAGKPIEEG